MLRQSLTCWGKADRAIYVSSLGVFLQGVAHRGRNLGAEQLDRPHRLGMPHGADAHLHQIAPMAERLVLVQDLLDHLFGAADREMALYRQAGVELRARGRRPAALAADSAHLRRIAREELVGGL